MVCPSCGTENADGKKFCTECGTALALVCPSCGSPVDDGQKFCGECGTSLAAPTTAQEPRASEPAAERRLVSVLFADLVGFTTLSESRDAEDVRELLSRYFESCRRLISLYGGVVEKFIGDAVMAVWGTPTATEDDAERAVRAGLDLVSAVTALGDELGAPELRARAGVVTGEAAVNLAAQSEGMVAGDLVNTGARVQSVAEPGSVYVSDSTRRATDAAIAYEDAGSFELKGKQGETPLWKALRVVSGTRGSLRSQGLEAPFVGRDRELRQIKDLFHTSADERKAHLVSATGIAGIGKSRLAWEFYKYFDGLAQLVYWHRGRCLAYGEGVTYWALADMVRMRCRIGEDEDADSALQKMRATLDEHVLDADERRFVEPRLAQLLALGDQQATDDRQELFGAWRLFFERLSDGNPVVMVFEDMQWADASLLDFVEYVLEWSRSHPLLVVTLARPELLEKRAGWGAGLRNFTSIYLEPLPATAMEELLGGLVPGLPGDLRDRILERAEGVPLYAVETVRMLIDRGALVQEGSVYKPVGEVPALEVPETLHALIAARLDGLPAEERRLLQDAAVVGKTFARPALSAVSGVDEAALEPLLSSLVRKEVLGLHADPRSPERGQYGFLQDLVRHVAYETLSKRERRARHLAAAAHLESLVTEDEIAEVIASHLVEAHRLAPDAGDADAIQARAREALERAGERADSLGAAAEALRYFERAAELTQNPRYLAPILERAGQTALRAADVDRSRELLERACELHDADGNATAGARVSARLAELDFIAGHPTEAAQRMERALAELSDVDPDADIATATAQLGRFLVFAGQPERAAPYLDDALSIAERLDLVETIVHVLNSKGVLALRGDRLQEARILIEGALDLAVQHDLHAVALRSLNNLSVTMDSLSDFSGGLEYARRGADIARRVGDRSWETAFVAGQIGNLVLLGRWDEALEHLRDIEELGGGVRYSGANRLPAMAITVARGELEAARAELEATRASLETYEDPQVSSAFAVEEAYLLVAEGKPHEALRVIDRALAMRDALGATFITSVIAISTAMRAAHAAGDTERLRELLAFVDALPAGQARPYLRAHGARFRALVASDPADAEREFSLAEDLFRHVGALPDLGETLVEHAEALLAGGDRDPGHERLDEAIGILEQLRAKPWLKRARRAASGRPAVEALA